MNPTPNPDRRPVHTIQNFCDDHRIGRTLWYEMRKAGKGPRLMKLGRRVLITEEAAADWRREREAEAAGA